MKKLRTMIASVGAAALLAITGTGAIAAPADLSSPAADLRVALNRLLSEHASLAMEAMRQGIDTGNLEDPEFVAAATALQGNTDDLTGAIESVYGADAGEAFRAQWEAHIGFFVNYTVGLATDDQAAQDAALDDAVPSAKAPVPLRRAGAFPCSVSGVGSAPSSSSRRRRSPALTPPGGPDSRCRRVSASIQDAHLPIRLRGFAPGGQFRTA